MVAVQAKLLGLKLRVWIKFRLTALLVPPDVTTVTLTVPGNVKFEVGTMATMPVSDQPPEFGTTVAETLPCVKTTLPGAD
jgi:hypothetical protein